MAVAIVARKKASTPAEKCGLAAITLACLFAFLDVRLAALPLVPFLALCILAPFFPGFGFYLPVIGRGPASLKAVSLTFDDGPDPATTPKLLKLLSDHHLKAAFFVTGLRAGKYPDLIESIIAGGHAIGNHSFSHTHLALFKSVKTMRTEIEATQSVLSAFAVRPLAFRPPAGITNPRFRPVLEQADMYVVNWSCRAFDGGNRWIKKISKRILSRVRPGDIILLHDSRPKNDQPVPDWLRQIEQLIVGLEGCGLAVLPLAELIGRPVMETRPLKKSDRPSEQQN